MSVQHKQISSTAEDLGNRMIRFCASNEEEDRDGDILIATGCDFTNYAKNPQFLGFHNWHDFPLGVPKNWGADPLTKKVFIDVYFPTVEELATDKTLASEKAKLVDFTYNCYKTGMLRAVSVGFIALESEKNKESKTPWGQIITKWEIVELSAVPVPSNQSALAEAIKSFDPSGKLFDIFDVKAPVEKAGRRLSKQTIKVLDEVRGCHDRVKECTGRLAQLSDELDAKMKELLGEAEDETEEQDESSEDEQEESVLDIMD